MNRAAVINLALRSIPVVVILLGLMLVLLSLPLISGTVGPNHSYGIRTAHAFASTEEWYRVNRLGGWVMLAAGAAMTFGGLAGLILSRRALVVYVCSVPLMIAAVLAATVYIVNEL